ncbi:MAG: MFS transporter [Deltaproteobacteria bacterium]|nr:MFS transporter [Deltaproteobacteria bacterium]
MLVRNKTLGFLFSLSIITYLDRVCISVAGPRMQADLGLRPQDWGWVVGIFTLGYALFEIPTGAMADRLGARKVLVRIVLWWSVFTVMTGWVTGFTMLLVVRFAFGAGEAGAYPGATSAIGRWFPNAQRARAQSVVWTASRLGAVLSPLLVVPIQQRWGWRASFWSFGGLGFVWAILFYFWYRDNPREKKGITEKELAELESSGAGTATHHADWKGALRNATFWKLLVMYHLYCWSAYFYFSWMPTFLQKGLGFDEASMKNWSTLAFLIGAGANVVGGMLSDRLVKRRGLRFGRRMVGASGLMFGGLCMIGTATTSSPTLAATLLCLGILGMDMFLPVAWATSLDVSSGHGGSISGAMNMAGQLGSFISSVAFGYLVGSYGYSMALLPLAIGTFIAGGLFLTIDPNQSVFTRAVASE